MITTDRRTDLYKRDMKRKRDEETQDDGQQPPDDTPSLEDQGIFLGSYES